MRARTVTGWMAALIALSLAIGSAQAQTNSRLADVQRAYAEVDYAATRTLAISALELGDNDRSSTAQLYLLWATAAAALGHAEEARAAFVFALAADPNLKLDSGLSPKIRAPYLEARGSLSSTDGKPALDVTLQRRKQELTLALQDPFQVAAGLALATRTSEAQPFVQQRLAAEALRRLPPPPGAELQFFVRVLDRHGNVLFERGTEDEPQRLALGSSRTAAPSPARASSTDASAAPYYLTAASLAVLGLASGGVATIMYVRREDAAREWNGPGCEQPGSTRGEQCGNVDDRRRSADTLAIGFSAAGGALLLGSLVSLVLAPSRSATRAAAPAVALAATPESVSLRLRSSF